MGRAKVTSFLLLAVTVSALGALPWEPPPPLSNVMVWISTSTLHARYGIKIDHIGVLAAGRLVEVRFRVLDRAKARHLFALGPALRGEDGALLRARKAWKRAQPKDDGTCSVFFPNRRGAIEPGSYVSLAIGEQRLEPMVAR